MLSHYCATDGITHPPSYRFTPEHASYLSYMTCECISVHMLIPPLTQMYVCILYNFGL